MAEKTKDGKKKTRILRWRGVMADSPRMLRWMVGVVFAVAGATFTFTQLGFVDVTMPDGYVGYAVVLLQTVALGALLLGTLAGVALGLTTGAILLAHAQVLPLDHYELTFVTPITSVAMFGTIALLLGIMFAFVLRNDPGQVKRVVYISIVCIVMSWLYSLGFFLNAVVSVAEHFALDLGIDMTESIAGDIAISVVSQFGQLDIQAWTTALLMIVLCCLGDFVARKVQAHRGVLGLRTVFGAWLSVVVALAFMAMAAASFAVATGDALRDAEEDMLGEVEYLSLQIEKADERANTLFEMFENGGGDYEKLDADLITQVYDHLDDADVLEGFSFEDDGTVLMVMNGNVYASDDERFPEGTDIEDLLTPDAIRAVDLSMQTGRMQRFVFEDPKIMLADEDSEMATTLERASAPHIAYVCAKDASGVFETSNGDLDFEQKVILIRDSGKVFAKRGGVMASMTASSLVLLLAVYVIVFLLLNRVVGRRIDEENEALALITGGDFDTRAQAGGTREFESLSNGINETVDALKGWIAEAESRMKAELATARAIQESALPRIFPPFPDIMKFDVYAIMNAAREVGGDFYDFFLVGDESGSDAGKVAFIVADVSGKGVPAALFMMKAKALLRDYVESGMELGEAVTEANRQLVDGNDAGMFVTAWVGLLDYGTGHVEYVNAGHNPPLLWARESGWQWMKKKSGPVLGLFEMPYRAHEAECLAGDTFLLYTDGVTEAFDVNECLYGEERLLAVAEESYRMHPRELIERVRASVAAYAEGAEQSDDITILALEVGVPPEVTATLEVLARVEELDRVNAFLHAELDRRLCPQRVQNQLDIAVEELFVNVCRYAYPGATSDEPGGVRIQRTYNADPPSVTVDIIDAGIPYDPLAKPDAVTPSNIEDVPIGGLGILMAKKCTDEMRYERTDGCNIVTIVKKW